MYWINAHNISVDPRVGNHELTARDLELEAEAWLADPVKVELAMHRLGEKIVVRGKVLAIIRQTCSRCLTDYKLPIKLYLAMMAVPASDLGQRKLPAASDDEASDDEDTVLWIIDGKFDIAQEIRSAIVVALPIKPLCNKDCLGLCAQCGAKLSETTCRCGLEKENMDAGGK